MNDLKMIVGSQGDKIVVKNTDNNRYAVMLPSHSFFGAVQLSEVGL